MTPLNTIIEEETCRIADEYEAIFIDANAKGSFELFKNDLTTAMQRVAKTERISWLRSEIEKIVLPTPPNVMIPSESPIEHALREGEYHALTSIITRYKEELKVLESK